MCSEEPSYVPTPTSKLCGAPGSKTAQFGEYEAAATSPAPKTGDIAIGSISKLNFDLGNPPTHTKLGSYLRLDLQRDCLLCSHTSWA